MVSKKQAILISVIAACFIIGVVLFINRPIKDDTVTSVIEQYFTATSRTDWATAGKLLTGAQAKIFAANTQGVKNVQPCSVQLLGATIENKNKQDNLAICKISMVLSNEEWSSREDYLVSLIKQNDGWRIFEIKPAAIKDNLSDQGKMPDGIESIIKTYLVNAATGNWAAIYTVLTSPALQEAKQTAALVSKLPYTAQVNNIKIAPVLTNSETAWITANYDLTLNGQVQPKELLIKLRTVNGTWKVFEVMQN